MLAEFEIPENLDWVAHCVLLYYCFEKTRLILVIGLRSASPEFLIYYTFTQFEIIYEFFSEVAYNITDNIALEVLCHGNKRI